MNAIHDLFTLEPENPAGTETGRIFSEAETRLSRQANDGQQPGGPADAERMAGVASVEDLVDPDEEEARKTGDQSRIVNDILAGCGVSSTLEHDKIVNGKLVVQPDPVMIEKEARRIAAEAVKGLKRAEALAQQVPIGTVTWTGERGSAGRPGRALGGPASSSLLSGLQSQPARRDLTPEELLAKIKAFIVAHGGEVRSGMLVDHFGSMCRTEEQREQFPVLLREIATLERSGPMRSTWRLKEEYRR
jgi:DNA excision repair protein ERCC-6